jgi:hypothetical protein
METKRIILLFSYIVLFSLLSSAMTFTVDGVMYDTGIKNISATVVGFETVDENATISIPDTVDYCGISFPVFKIDYKGGGLFKKLIIPKNIRTFEFLRCGPNVKEIEVSPENNFFSSLDNLLLSKDKKKLIYYPRLDDRSEFIVPQEVKQINSYAFTYPLYLRKVSILHKCSISANSFYYCHDFIETIELDYTEEDLNDSFQPVFNAKAFYVPNGLMLTKIHWRTLKLGKNICDPCFLSMETYYVDTIEVDLDNNFFCVEDGLLLSKDKKELYRVPSTTIFVDSNGMLINGVDLIIPEGVENMGHDAFKAGSYYTFNSITFPSTLKNLSGVLSEADGLDMEFVEFKDGNNLKEIPDNFLRGKLLGKLILPKSLKYIGAYAFYGNQLTHQSEIVLPENLDSIGDYAFCGMRATNIVLPAKIKKIGAGAFLNNKSLTVVCYAATPPECNVITEEYVNDHNEHYYVYTYPFNDQYFNTSTLIVPKGGRAIYKNALVWKEFQKIVEGNFDSINNISIDALDGYVDVYNMQGQLLRHQVLRASATQGLPPGIYIVGHDKVIVR